MENSSLSVRKFFGIRELNFAFLLFCLIVYLNSALQDLFPETTAFTVVGVLLVWVVWAAFRVAIRLGFPVARLSLSATACLFLSFLTWEVPFANPLITVLSLLLAALSLAFYLACGLRGLQFADNHASHARFLRPITGVVFGLFVLAAVFILLRLVCGWFLAMRLMLLVPAVSLVLEIRQKRWRHATQLEKLLIKPHFKKEWPAMLAYSFLFSGATLFLIHLVGRFILQLQDQVVVQALLMLLFAVAVFVLVPLKQRFHHYFLSIAAILLLLASAVISAADWPQALVWVLLAILAGLSFSAAGLSIKSILQHREGVAKLRLLYISVLFALALVSLYPILALLLGAYSLLLTPVLLFLALLFSFFVGHDSR